MSSFAENALANYRSQLRSQVLLSTARAAEVPSLRACVAPVPPGRAEGDVILIMNIDISVGNTASVAIHAGEDVCSAVRLFVLRHDLPPHTVEPLVRMIWDKVQTELALQEPPVSPRRPAQQQRSVDVYERLAIEDQNHRENAVDRVTMQTAATFTPESAHNQRICSCHCLPHSWWCPCAPPKEQPGNTEVDVGAAASARLYARALAPKTPAAAPAPATPATPAQKVQPVNKDFLISERLNAQLSRGLNERRDRERRSAHERMVAEEQELRECTFRPIVSQSGVESSLSPIERSERLYQSGVNKIERIAAASAAPPTPLARSQHSRGHAQGPVRQREPFAALYADHMRREQVAAARAAAEEGRYSYVPQVGRAPMHAAAPNGNLRVSDLM